MEKKYLDKYLKYKKKYLELKGGMNSNKKSSVSLFATSSLVGRNPSPVLRINNEECRTVMPAFGTSSRNTVNEAIHDLILAFSENKGIAKSGTVSFGIYKPDPEHDALTFRRYTYDGMECAIYIEPTDSFENSSTGLRILRFPSVIDQYQRAGIHNTSEFYRLNHVSMGNNGQRYIQVSTRTR